MCDHDFSAKLNVLMCVSLTNDHQERVCAMGGTPRDLNALITEVLALSVVLDSANPKHDAEDVEAMKSALDATRLLVAAVPAQNEHDLWRKACAVGDAEPCVPENELLPLIARAALQADAKRLFKNGRFPAWLKDVAF